MKTKDKTFIFHQDPGHGWLEVSRADLADVGVKPASISPYSYFKGDSFFLEEDCDFETFFKAYDSKYGRGPTYRYKDSDGDSFIRNLPHIPEAPGGWIPA